MRILLIFLFIKAFSFVSLDINLNPNIVALRSLNIEESFIKDKKTQELFRQYSKNKKQLFLHILENGYSFIPLIKKEINKFNVPSNLIFVAMAESNFYLGAKNKKAIGLWQIMPSTAKRLGLTINKYVDERRDPIKSTISAIKYLYTLKQHTKKWYLAIMAYNCGEARVIEALTRAKLDKYCQTHKCNNTKIKTIRNYIKLYQRYGYKKFYLLKTAFKEANKLYPQEITLSYLLRVQKKLRRQYLPKETRDYIRKIIALNFLVNSNNFLEYKNHYILNSGTISNLTKVEVPEGTSLKYISKLLNIDYHTLRKNNLHLKYDFTPPNQDSYIYIPYDKVALFKLNFNKYSIIKKIVYNVKKGDSLNKIGKKFGVNYKVIQKANNLKSSILKINQKLIIPINTTTNLAME